MALDPLDWSFKGLPARETSVPLDEIGQRGWNVLREDVMFPVATLRQSALAHNSNWMRRFTELTGVRICPHGKTTMSPQLFEMQIADGAWGMTAATASHVRTYRKFGVSRIILANQLIGRQNVGFVLDELRRDPEFDFYCLADSFRCVEILERAVAAQPLRRPLQLLLELGIEGGRTGVRADGEAMAIAQRIAASPHLSLRGIEAFEGIVQRTGHEPSEDRMQALLDRIVSVAEACQEGGLFDGTPLLTAGGSSFFDAAAATLSRASTPDFQVVLRSGCYLVHDSAFYQQMVSDLLARSPEAASLGEGLKPALEIWAHVHSRPEPSRAILGFGKRDTSFDAGMPTPLAWARSGWSEARPVTEGHKVVRLDDQHAYLDVPADSPLEPGDIVAVGVSHPCTTFDRWQALYLVDDALNVTGAVRTYF